MRVNIDGGRCGNSINDAVTVCVVAYDGIDILIVDLIGSVRNSYNLRTRLMGEGYTLAQIVEKCDTDPLVTVYNNISLVPVVVVFIPTEICCLFLYKYRNIRHSVENTVVHSEALAKNYTFKSFRY